MRQAGVSRIVVREAVAALRAEELIVTHQGVGAFVADHPGKGLFRLGPAEAEGLHQVPELRLAPKVEAASLAAGRFRPETLAPILAAQTAFATAAASDDPAEEADIAFHRAVAAATGNPFSPVPGLPRPPRHPPLVRPHGGGHAGRAPRLPEPRAGGTRPRHRRHRVPGTLPRPGARCAGTWKRCGNATRGWPTQRRDD